MMFETDLQILKNEVASVQQKYPHYHKKVGKGMVTIDVYRVLDLFDVTDPCLQHAVKKVLVAGARGVKPSTTDITEAIVSLQRYLQMREEDRLTDTNFGMPAPFVVPAPPPAEWGRDSTRDALQP